MGGRLFWSDDFGAAPSWKDATPRLEGALTASPGLPPAMRGVVDVFAHPDAPCRLLIQGAGSLHWTTSDCGKTFAPAPAPAGTAGWFADFKLHPTQPSWILSKVRRAECHRRGASGSKWCAYDLFVSKDFAGTWSNLTAASGGAVASFWDYDWGANLLKKAGSVPAGAAGGKGTTVKDATIFATAYESAAHMKGPYPGWDKDMHFIASHDFFKSAHTKVASCGNQFEVVGRTLYLAMPADCPAHPDGSPRPRHTPSSAKGGSNVVLYTSADEGASWAQACLQAFEPALAQLTEGRIREGERLAATMLATSAQMQEVVGEVESHMPELLAAQREKLAQKLRETVQSAFPGGFTHITGAELSERIASESSLFALRIDVAEELARLKSHIVELEFLLSGKKREGGGRGAGGKDPGSVGKRLDFLFQEMNREANTLGSKAGSMDMTRAAMDLKLLIEQMREQAQNIE